MTRKHYNALATALNKEQRRLTHEELGGFQVAVDCIMVVLKADNSNFDGARFRTAVFTAD